MSEYVLNGTVERLYHYQPFDAAGGSLYEEHLTPGVQRPEFQAKALDYLDALCRRPHVQLVVLTGNAGHGKTHLCRRLLERHGVAPEEAMQKLGSDQLGADSHGGQGGTRPLRVIKDLSEIPEAVDAPGILANLIDDVSSVGIVCANEGRLRDVASQNPERLGVLLKALDATLRVGQTSEDERVHVVNLNFQSVTPRDQEGFLDYVLDYWTRDGRKWTACSNCKAADACPILRNRDRLGTGNQGDETARARRAALRQLTRIAEQTGYVMTFRETLVFAAFLLTSGLSCSKVHELHQRDPESLEDHHFESSLFERELLATHKEQLGILLRLRRLDPGRASLRDVDQRLHSELEEHGALGGDALISSQTPATTRKELMAERKAHQHLVRSARRRDFFVGPSLGEEGERERARRLGFHQYAKFEALFRREPDPKRMVAVLEDLIEGVHAIQGVRTATRNVLYLVDPAFAREGSRAAVIAQTIPATELALESESRYWRRLAAGAEPPVVQACDWLDRRVLLVHEAIAGGAPEVLLSLDLLQFEFVLQAARGVVFGTFHAADRRRVLGRLARRAEAESTSGQGIRIVDGNAIREIWVDKRVGTIAVGNPS